MEVSSLQRPIKAADLPLERLAGNKSIPEADKVAEVGRQFESMLLRNILTQAHKPVFGGGKKESSSDSIYQDMITNNLADQISRSGGLGLADAWSTQLTRELSNAGAPTVKEASNL
jgi:Rod binding domain-containing protein